MQKVAPAFYKFLQSLMCAQERDAPDGSSQVGAIRKSIADIAKTIYPCLVRQNEIRRKEYVYNGSDPSYQTTLL